jgi:hypothetical protein
MLGNLIDRGGAVLISGPQKIGKSLFGSQLALSLAAGTPFLGMATGTERYRTLILQAEVSPKRMKERFAKQVGELSALALSRVENACVFSSIRLDSNEGRDTVRSWVEQHKPDLLIVDPLANFHIGNENEAQDMRRVTAALDEVREMGVAVVLVHHHGKSSVERSNVGHKSRGSSVLPGWYDSHFSLEWAEFGKTVRLRFELRHDETPEDKILRLNRDTLQFEIASEEVTQIALVISAIQEIGPADAESVGRHCNMTREWARQWLNKAVEEGKLIRTPGRPVLFSLPGQVRPTTTVEVPTDHGPVVVTTNTAVGLGVEGPAGADWLQQFTQ